MKPDELVEAELILGLCEKFHCLPSQLLNEDVEMLKLLQVEIIGRPKGGLNSGLPLVPQLHPFVKAE